MSSASFLAEVYETGTPRETKADVVDYYQGKYPGTGRGGWKQHLISDLLGSQDITIGSVGEVEYKRQVKNISRRFDPSRLDHPEPRNAGQYRTLGELLPPIPPDSRGQIWGTIWVKYSDDCVEREIDDPPMELSADDVKRLFDMSVEQMIQSAANGYQSNEPGDTNIDFKGPSWCAEPDLHFSLIE